MHPAYSVIVFTTASGAGYGLLIWLSAGVALGLLPKTPVIGLVGLGLSLVLITVGLLSSMLHLGRPERAWRAFSQWRTSWLSREGVAAIVTYLPAVALGLGWGLGVISAAQTALAAWLAIGCALVTLYCTGMIYASLPTVRAWHQPLVTPIYIALALATGGVLLTALLSGLGRDARWAAVVTALALAAGWILKVRYWSAIDRAPRTHTAEDATGLGSLGTVRPLDPPHTQPNFVMREMGYQVARRHAQKLRKLAVWLLFIVPLLLTLIQFVPMPRAAQVAAAALAVLSAIVGVLVERWLFFAEAEHVVTVYYRGGAA
jgi:sulfite dehydrogenase (quinone) subunit SoeC